MSAKHRPNTTDVSRATDAMDGIGSRFGSAREAARLLGVDEHVVRKLAARGLIGVKQIPGTRPRYDLADCRRLAEASTTPAMFGA